MHFITKLAVATTMAISLATVHAEVNVKTDMRTMGAALKEAEAAKDVNTLKTQLIALRDAAAKSKTKVQTAPGQTGDREKTYVEGINKLIAALDESINLANAGKLEEAKASLGKIKDTRNEYHKKMRD